MAQEVAGAVPEDRCGQDLLMTRQQQAIADITAGNVQRMRDLGGDVEKNIAKLRRTVQEYIDKQGKRFDKDAFLRRCNLQ